MSIEYTFILFDRRACGGDENALPAAQILMAGDEAEIREMAADLGGGALWRYEVCGTDLRNSEWVCDLAANEEVERG